MVQKLPVWSTELKKIIICQPHFEICFFFWTGGFTPQKIHKSPGIFLVSFWALENYENHSGL